MRGSLWIGDYWAVKWRLLSALIGVRGPGPVVLKIHTLVSSMDEDEKLTSFLRGSTVRAVDVADLEEGFEKEVLDYSENMTI